MSVRLPPEAYDLGNHWTDWILLFREYTYWSCGGFRLFSKGGGTPPTPPKIKKIPINFFDDADDTNYLVLHNMYYIFLKITSWGKKARGETASKAIK